MFIPLTQTLENLKSLILDENCKFMNLSTVKGYYGELIVKQRLENEGCEIEHFGNQSGYDLTVVYNRQPFKIDVKWSALKDEHNWGIPYWGWALQYSNKKRQLTATHLICVASRNDLSTECFFIIRSSDVKRFPIGAGQFKNVKHGFRIPQDLKAKLPNSVWRPTFDQSKQLIKKGFAIKVNNDRSLIDSLIALS